MPAPEPIDAVRVVASEAAIDGLADSPATLRLASDEALILGDRAPAVDDPYAIVFADTGWVRFRLSPDDGAEVMSRLAAWPPPDRGFAQGMVAGVPAKLVVTDDEWWFIVSHTVAAEFGERL